MSKRWSGRSKWIVMGLRSEIPPNYDNNDNDYENLIIKE